MRPLVEASQTRTGFTGSVPRPPAEVGLWKKWWMCRAAAGPTMGSS